MCKARQQGKPTPPPIPKFVVGEEGLTMVKYIGWLEEDYYVGETTGAVYIFGLGGRQKGYIDSRDLDGMLKVDEDGQMVFVNGNSN